MKIKDRSNGKEITRAELTLNGKSEVDRLRKVLAVYEQFARDVDAPFIIPLPLPVSTKMGRAGRPRRPARVSLSVARPIPADRGCWEVLDLGRHW